VRQEWTAQLVLPVPAQPASPEEPAATVDPAATAATAGSSSAKVAMVGQAALGVSAVPVAQEAQLPLPCRRAVREGSVVMVAAAEQAETPVSPSESERTAVTETAESVGTAATVELAESAPPARRGIPLVEPVEPEA